MNISVEKSTCILSGGTVMQCKKLQHLKTFSNNGIHLGLLVVWGGGGDVVTSESPIVT